MSNDHRKHATAALLSGVAFFAVILATADASLPFVHDVLFNGEHSAARLVNFAVNHLADKPPASQGVADKAAPPPASDAGIWQAMGGDDIGTLWPPASPFHWNEDNTASPTQNPTLPPAHGPEPYLGGWAPFGGASPGPLTLSYSPPIGGFGGGGGRGGGDGGGGDRHDHRHSDSHGNPPTAPGCSDPAPSGPGPAGPAPSGPAPAGAGPNDPNACSSNPGSTDLSFGEQGPGSWGASAAGSTYGGPGSSPIVGQPPQATEPASVVLDHVPAQVPEPASLLVFGTAVLGLGITAVRRRRRQS